LSFPNAGELFILLNYLEAPFCISYASLLASISLIFLFVTLSGVFVFVYNNYFAVRGEELSI